MKTIHLVYPLFLREEPDLLYSFIIRLIIETASLLPHQCIGHTSRGCADLLCYLIHIYRSNFLNKSLTARRISNYLPLYIQNFTVMQS